MCRRLWISFCMKSSSWGPSLLYFIIIRAILIYCHVSNDNTVSSSAISFYSTIHQRWTNARFESLDSNATEYRKCLLHLWLYCPLFTDTQHFLRHYIWPFHIHKAIKALNWLNQIQTTSNQILFAESKIKLLHKRNHKNMCWPNTMNKQITI